ncbi:MAG: BlaI/MecI/CopY family transcriptional regulator [Methylacidiphilales bacterium]|nr:BlaI/MecI/CopY family transcriptional regulator [Candidatus Methylacidiphilales bacterium]
MGKSPRISEAEWVVMEVVWRRHPVTALEVVRQLAAHKQWQDQTIRTMLRRLIRKKALSYRAEGKTYYYSPAVSREQCVRGESRSFLERVFGGAAHPLLVQLVQEAKLSPEEIAELKRILRNKEKR